MATMQGVLLGTAAYMSPEQARGKSVDKRTDMRAFGCLLYEMLTGKQAFQGEDTTDILAAVVRAEPNSRALPAATSTQIRKLLKRCLRKDKALRIRDAGDARIEIREALAAPKDSDATTAQSASRSKLPWVVAAAFELTSYEVSGYTKSMLSAWDQFQRKPDSPSCFALKLSSP